jgi:hypothetical protein
MKHLAMLLVLVAIVMAAMCGGCDQQNNDPNADMARTGRMIFGSGPVYGTGGSGSGDATPDSYSQPQQDMVSIALISLQGSGHEARAEMLRQDLSAKTGWDLFLYTRGNATAVMRGRYPSLDAAQNDLAASKRHLYNDAPIFRGAMIVPLATADVGPEEWNLENCRGSYSVVVAVFYDDPEHDYVGRKKFALDYVRELRQKGENAFYYHGPSKSSVTIGDFPADAVVETPVAGKAARVDIRDPRIKQVMTRHPLLAVNGREFNTRQPGAAEWKKAESYPIEIPKPKTPTSATEGPRRDRPQYDTSIYP